MVKQVNIYFHLNNFLFRFCFTFEKKRWWKNNIGSIFSSENRSVQSKTFLFFLFDKKKIFFFHLGNRLHVVNLSQQSDSVDLLGGYKPYDSVLLVKQIYRDFTYEQTNNEIIEQVQVN